MSAYLLHMRPRSWPVVAAHCAAGFLCGTAMIDGPVIWWRMPVAAIVWAVLLNGGTLALNSAFDKDTGSIGYLDSPPPIPRGLAFFGVALIIFGLLAGVLVSKTYLAAYAVCTVLSILYSCPPVRLKAVPFADLAINCTGYGALTFLGGWVASGAAMGMTGWCSVAGFFLLFGALYPLTQIYQIESDAAAGDNTMAVFMGRKGALILSAVCATSAFGCFFAAAMKLGRPNTLPLVPGALFWGILLGAWLAGAVRREKEGMYWALYAWALTDVGLVAAYLIASRG